MKLSLWTYEGPAHVGAMRVAASMRDVHLVLHAPQGDTYADLLFTMIERRATRPPVTYTTFDARDLGRDTAELFRASLRETDRRFSPGAILAAASCTAELLQDDPAGLSRGLNLAAPVIPLELPAYSKKENWGAGETFYRIVRSLADPSRRAAPRAGRRPRCNLLGPTALGFRNRDDVAEITRLLTGLGIDVALVAPLGASAADIAGIGEADFNIALYPEIANPAAQYLEKHFGQPCVRSVPIGIAATRLFITDVCAAAGLPNPDEAALGSGPLASLRAGWWSRSVDSTYLTGKRVFIFGDATHVLALARMAQDEIGFTVCGIGTYSREFARDIRAAAAEYGCEALITDDYLDVEAAIAALAPELVLGTQMERHIAKRLGVGCAVISAPFHVQDHPARYSPQMGAEGANVLFDTIIHPLVMGLESHLLEMFRDDFEFSDSAGASHLGAHALPLPANLAEPHGRADSGAPQHEAEVYALQRSTPAAAITPITAAAERLDAGRLHAVGGDGPIWEGEAERELKKIPFFVRGKARRNTESFAKSQGIHRISLTTLYDAKAYYAS